MSNPPLPEVARYRVLFDDCDPMRIMYYGSYCRLFEIGWTELFRQLGQPLHAQMSRGVFIGVVEVACRYLKPARYDDELIIRAGLTDMGLERFTIHYEISGVAGQVVATGRTLHAVHDQAHRLQEVPPEFQHLPVCRAKSDVKRV